MRLCFGELGPGELEARARLCEDAKRAWTLLAAGNPRAACDAMQRIDPRLVMSLAKDPATGATCVELVPLEASAWPLAELCLSVAPSELGCALLLGRAPVTLEQALEEARAVHSVELARCTLRAGFGRGHLLDVTLGVPGGKGSEIEQNAAENLVRAVLGDRLFETWVGAVHVTPAPRGGSLRVLDVTAPRTTLTLPELFDTVAAAALGVLEGLRVPPEVDVHASQVRSNPHDAARDITRGEWTMLEVEPLADERGERKDDLLLASTSTPELLRCYLDGAPCASRRFSSSGERFVFLSYVDDSAPLEQRLARRSVVEAALAEALAEVGRVTGVGVGVKTTYVDVALCPLETGLTRLVSKLRELDLPRRSFIQFFDSELSEEWLSIWPDTRLTGE